MSYFSRVRYVALVCGLITALGVFAAMQAISSQPVSAASRYWHAVASAVWHDSSGRARVSVGYSGARTTGELAHQWAVYYCKQGGGGSYCEPSTAYNYGCLYITYGTNSNGVISRGRGSYAEAYDACISDGYNCATPVGGCLD